MTTAISTTATDLDVALGDPFCPANPHGATAILAADERAERALATYQLLADLGLQRMFVPIELGGDLVDIRRWCACWPRCSGATWGWASDSVSPP